MKYDLSLQKCWGYGLFYGSHKRAVLILTKTSLNAGLIQRGLHAACIHQTHNAAASMQVVPSLLN